MKLYALPDVEAPETLQVMTIHKAKGAGIRHRPVPGLASRPPDDPAAAGSSVRADARAATAACSHRRKEARTTPYMPVLRDC
jgi:hypothetical protein